jgi:hypothetical protein
MRNKDQYLVRDWLNFRFLSSIFVGAQEAKMQLLSADIDSWQQQEAAVNCW